jgi:thiol-disulfide isomerase/thioredoxin
MARFLDVVQRNLRPYSFYFFIFCLVIIFGAAAYYMYSKYQANQTKFNNVPNVARVNGVVTIYMFHVNWCPHCKKAMPEWQSFVDKYNGKEINGYEIKCVDMDCTKETSDVAVAMKKYNIESYPTIKMLKNDQIIEFDSKITETTLEQFADTMLNQD